MMRENWRRFMATLGVKVVLISSADVKAAGEISQFLSREQVHVGQARKSLAHHVQVWQDVDLFPLESALPGFPVKIAKRV